MTTYGLTLQIDRDDEDGTALTAVAVVSMISIDPATVASALRGVAEQLDHGRAETPLRGQRDGVEVAGRFGPTIADWMRRQAGQSVADDHGAR